MPFLASFSSPISFELLATRSQTAKTETRCAQGLEADGREGWRGTRCMVARLMRRLWIRGVIRGKRVRTTTPRPNQMRASDVTPVSTCDVLGQVECCGRSSWLKEQAPERSTCEVLNNMKSSFDRREKIITVIILMPLF